MNTTIAPVDRHIHVDLDVDREHQFHYRSQGHDGHRVILHRGDSVTFTCADDFSVRFEGPSPFAEPVLYSRHSFLLAHVRTDAAFGSYRYVVEVVKEDGLVTDSGSAVVFGGLPEIVVEAEDTAINDPALTGRG